MLTNPRSDRVRSVRALSRRSVRSRTGLFLAEGPQSVREAVVHRAEHVRDVYVTAQAAQRHTDIITRAEDAGLHVHETSADVLSTMAETETPQGIVAVCRRADLSLDAALAGLPPDAVVCVLTHVRDPGNAGTVIRGADAAGADLVVVSDASVDVYAPKVVRSTAGSIFHLPVVVGRPVNEILAALAARGIRRLAADGAGTTLLHDAPLDGPHAWVMGNEAWGLPAEVRAQCDDVVRVPIYGLAESLNLAMAATVCLYASAEARRRAGR
ncbi:RNA methyltransferase [Intrasporangium chromatireducens Q5-1]|uniref:RNA methyltransferase n=1 Tax=Intrasporangium chromatireducens Q5-1 TaxID=584657 RepID=W9GF77_9MICO|nr:RNA methyltransferase [Intrasporangium chromatireducens]EWT04871.1 RNA methyltransferase [Intrasporangium chromatireducens Q5-1]